MTVPWDKVLPGAVIGGTSAGVFVALAMLALAKVLKSVPCPGVRPAAPMFRRPRSLR